MVARCWGGERVPPQMSQGNRTRATIGTYPSCLALIRPANAAAQLVLRTQARRKEQGPPRRSPPPSPLRMLMSFLLG